MKNTIVFDGYTSITNKTFPTIKVSINDNVLCVNINNTEKTIKMVEKPNTDYVYKLLKRQLNTQSIENFIKFLIENNNKESLFFTTVHRLLREIHNR